MSWHKNEGVLQKINNWMKSTFSFYPLYQILYIFALIIC